MDDNALARAIAHERAREAAERERARSVAARADLNGTLPPADEELAQLFAQFVDAMPEGTERPFVRGEFERTLSIERYGMFSRHTLKIPKTTYREVTVAQGWFVPVPNTGGPLATFVVTHQARDRHTPEEPVYLTGAYGLGITTDAAPLFALRADNKLIAGPCRVCGYAFHGLGLGEVVIVPDSLPTLRGILNDRLGFVSPKTERRPSQNVFGAPTSEIVRVADPDLAGVPNAMAAALAKAVTSIGVAPTRLTSDE